MRIFIPWLYRDGINPDGKYKGCKKGEVIHMSYKIAIASSDEIHINETFGSAKVFHIYEVTDGTYVKSEVRNAEGEHEGAKESAYPAAGTQDNSQSFGSCGSKPDNGCGNGGCQGGHGGGCSGSEGASWKVELLSDCRCIVCKKIGFHVVKQLERRAIASFDVSCTVEEALTKISSYFQTVDAHQSLRKNS